MAHTTSIYYRDRLGFEPDYEPHRLHSAAANASENKGKTTSRTSGVSNSSNGVKSSGNSSGIGKSSGSGADGGRMNNGMGDYVGVKVGNGHSDIKGGVYEENLNKFKGRARERN